MRNPPQTKERLLAAAREEFAAHGIAGARVDRIAELANVNKERIYGYFGSKEKLFDAVVTEALDELADAVPLSGDDPVDYVARVYDFHRDNPVLLRLLLWEALHFREFSLPNEADRAIRYRQKVDDLAKTLGGERSSQEVAACLLTIIGLAAWPHAVPQLARLILSTTETDPSDHNMREYVIDFAREALTGPATSRSDPALRLSEESGCPAARLPD